MLEHTTPIPLTSPSVGKEAPTSTVLSLLELLHPNGVAIRSLVLGSHCPAILLSMSRVEASKYADLVILAPTANECRTRGWLQEAVQSISQNLESNGVAYVLASPRWRLRIRKLLSDHGLSIDQEIIHLPDQGISRYLVPLSPIPAQYAFSELLPLPQWIRLSATIGFRFFGCNKLFRHILPSVGMAVRRPGARPLFEWLFRLKPQADRSGGVVIRTSWRGGDGAVILYRFLDCDDFPSAVAKMNLTTKTLGNLIREVEILDRLGPSARSAGAQIPQTLSLEEFHGRPVSLQSMICGQSGASVLISQPSRLIEIIDRLIVWLEYWNHSTMVTRPLDREFLEKELLSSAVLLAPLLERGEEYRSWLIHCCLTLTGIPATLVATHNDLTTWNILLGEQGRLGVIDWESASEKGLPFVDFFYAVNDATTVAKTNGDRLKAFKECFAVGGTYEYMVGQCLARLRRVVQIPNEMVGLCFHACWLHHAANEYRSTGSSDPRPFLQLVQWLSRNRANLCQWVHG